MGSQLLLLVVGFLLTGVLGTVLTSVFQTRTWNHQHEVEQRDEERQQALKTFEEVSARLGQTTIPDETHPLGGQKEGPRDGRRGGHKCGHRGLR